MNLLAFDLGAESGRAVLGTLDGERLRVQEVHRFDNTPVREDGHLYWDLPALWTNVQVGLRRVSERASTLNGIGIDTWGVDYALLAPDGRAIGRPFHYRDARNDGVMDETIARVGRDRIYELTGVQFLQFNTLFQLVAHARDDSAAIGSAQRLLFMPDVIRFLLSGAAHTEPTIASTSQMYDPRRHAWSEELLEAARVPARLLPPIEATGTISSPTKDSDLRCPVISTPGHDTACAVAAVPADEATNWCYISSGTWSLMGVERKEPVINSMSLKHNFTNEVGVGRSIRFLRNIMGLWLVQECRRDFASRGAEHTYAELAQRAVSTQCGAIIDPDHKPFLSPGDMPAKIERFCRETNQSPPRDEGQTIRCCLESLALAYRRTLECIEAMTGRRIEVIHVVGGGSQNELLNRMTADACARTVVTGPVEATAIGNLLVQAIALGEVDSVHHLRQIVARSFDAKRFDPVDPHAWEEKYARFREVAPA